MREAVGSGFVTAISETPEYDSSQIRGLQIWLDASDTTTITPARGTLVSWRDKASGYVFNTSTQMPSTGLNTLNGSNVISFPNKGVSTAISIAIPYPRTIIAVAVRTGGFTTTHRIFWTATNQGELNFGVGFGNSTTANGGVTMARAQTDNIFHVLCAIQNGASSILCVDNGWQTGTLGTNAINNRIWIGHESTSRLNGRIAEILVYNRALSIIEFRDIVQFLRQKWMI